jgi:hypothetical protein
MTFKPAQQRVTLIDNLMTSLKSIGLAKFDAFYVFAAHNAQAASLNWKAPATTVTPTNTPTFTINRGYVGTATAYLDSNFNPSTAGGAYAQNDCHMGIWVRTNAQRDNGAIGNTAAQINPRTQTTPAADRLAYRAQSTVFDGTSDAISTSIGHSCFNRSASGNYDSYKNGTALGNVTRTSSALSNANFYICGRNNAGTLSANTGQEISIAHWGSNLTSGQMSTLYTALNTYITAVGA